MLTIIYGLIDPRDQQLRYVGKTITTLAARLRQHVSDAIRGRVSIKRFTWIRELALDSRAPEIVELESVDGDSWREAEQFWISYYRFIGARLVNATNGGDGIVGFRHSDDSKRQQSESMRRYYANPANRAKSGEAVRRAYADPQVRQKLRDAIAPTWTAERRAKNAVSLTEIARRPESRAASSLRHKGKIVSSETRRKISIALTGKNTYKRSAATRELMRIASLRREEAKRVAKRH